MGKKNATPCLKALDYQLTENNAIPIKGHVLFKNLY